MKLRRLGVDDLDSWYSARLRGLAECPAAFGITLEEEIQRGQEFFREKFRSMDSDNVFFGATGNGDVFGIMHIMRSSIIKQNHIMSIYGLYVVPEKRGTGIAGGLLDLAVSYSSQLSGIKVIGLSVSESQSNALRLYLSRGFTVWGTEPKAERTSHDEYFDLIHLSLVL